MIRLYFNKRGDLPWSIDTGPGSPERRYKTVHVMAHGVTQSNGKEPNETEPVAWTEFWRGIVEEDRNVAVIREA